MSNEDEPKSTLEQRKALLESGELQRLVMKELLTPDAMASIREFQNSPVMQQIRDIQNSPVMQQIRDIQNSPVMQQIRAFQNSNVIQVLQGFQRLPVVENFRTVMEQFKSSVLPPEVAGTIRAVRALGIALNDIERSPLFQHIVSGQGSALGTMAPLSGHAVGSAVATADVRVITAQELELERNIVERLNRGEAVADLPKEQRQYLAWVTPLLFIIISYLFQQVLTRQELCFYQPKIAPMLTVSQAGKAVRKFFCEADMPAEMLQAYRLVDGDGVRLREGPGMKFGVVAVNLPDRSVLEVLDSSNRDWLHVSVVGEDGVEGWISRKYTHRLVR